MNNTPLRFKDFLNEANRRGLPTNRLTWIRYEKNGWIKFEKLPSGSRFFRTQEDIAKLLDEFEKERIK